MKSNLTFIKKPELFAELHQAQNRFYAVIDRGLTMHLPEWIVSSKTVFWLDQPEVQKGLETFEKISHFFLEAGINRSATVYAIGGGATTDLAGFVASAILRGVKWVSVPTTLLAMVDGSIGGKVGVNTSQGKNLLGAFHAPEQVFICHDFLSTLPLIEAQSGSGEILKYAFLSKKIFDLVLNKASLDVIAFECAQFKAEVVERDFKEQGERVLLNLGHTLGHAFESTLKIPHGLSVAMGIRYLLEIFSETQRLVEWQSLVTALNLPQDQLDLKAYPQFSVDKFKNYLNKDKKKNQQDLTLVLIKSIGNCYTQKIAFQEFLKKIDGHEAFR